MARRKVASQGFNLSVSELDDFYSDYKSIRPESTMSKKQFAKRVEQSYNYFSRLYDQEKSKGRALYVKDSPASYTNQYLNYISMGNSKDIAKQRIRAHIQTTYAEARELKKRGTTFVKKAKREQMKRDREQNKELKEIEKRYGKESDKYLSKRKEYEEQRSEFGNLIGAFTQTLNVYFIVSTDRKKRWDIIINTLGGLGYDGSELFKGARALYYESVRKGG